MSNYTDTNQPDHNEEVLEMVTDINQASEDRLRKDIEHIILTWSSEISGEPREKLHPETDQFVMRLIDLIRTEAVEKAKNILFGEKYSNCCGAGDIYDGNLDNNEGVCADCGEHCEMEGV